MTNLAALPDTWEQWSAPDTQTCALAHVATDQTRERIRSYFTCPPWQEQVAAVVHTTPGGTRAR